MTNTTTVVLYVDFLIALLCFLECYLPGKFMQRNQISTHHIFQLENSACPMLFFLVISRSHMRQYYTSKRNKVHTVSTTQGTSKMENTSVFCGRNNGRRSRNMPGLYSLD